MRSFRAAEFRTRLMQAIPDNLDYTLAEHISLGGEDESAEADATPRSVEYRLNLKRPSHAAEQTIKLYDDGSIGVEERHRKRSRRYTLHTRFLDPAPQVSRHIAKRAFITAGVTGGLGLALLALPIDFGAFDVWRLSGGILLATSGLFALLLAVYRTGDTLRFASLHGRVTVLTITGGICCQRRCAQLVERLAAASAAAREDSSEHEDLRDAMRDHHRLKQEGVIDDPAHEAAKLRILSAHD